MWPRAAERNSATKKMRPISRMMPPSVLTAGARAEAGACASIRDLQQDASASVSPFRQGGRLRRLLEREFGPDLWLEIPGSDQLAELLQDGTRLRGMHDSRSAHTPSGRGVR